jgi:hypothetical protein
MASSFLGTVLGFSEPFSAVQSGSEGLQNRSERLRMTCRHFRIALRRSEWRTAAAIALAKREGKRPPRGKLP